MYFENNILGGGENKGCTNCFFLNNVSFDSTAFGTTNGNKVVPMSDVFVGTGSTDGKWQLKPNSPAKGTASDGGDPGMFGGSEPYVLSGMTEIPAIYYFQAPTEGNIQNNLPIHIKVKSY